MEKITDLIDALVSEKTFSLEGVKSIEAVRLKAQHLQSTLEDTQKRYADAIKERDAEKKRADDTAEVCRQWKVREDAVVAREKTMTDKEKAAAVSEATANTFRECFGLVFRNFSINESITKSVPISQGAGMYPAQMTETANRIETKS